MSQYVENNVLHLDVDLDCGSQTFDIELSGGEGILPYYDGPYVVDPRKILQTFETKNKSMKNDVIVNEIFYSEVGNISGGNTAFIGME